MRSFRVLCALLACLAASGVAGEVAVIPGDGPLGTLILGNIGEDPDPIGIWLQRRPVSAEHVLNASGHARGDGRPDLCWRESNWPAAVWAYNLGTDHDIAYSEWGGAAWTPTEFLTSSTDNELDPRVAVAPDGTVHVVWWTAGATDEVYLRTRPAGSSLWNLPVPVTTGAEEGRRPAVAVVNGVVQVVYERDSASPGSWQQIVLATDVGAGGIVRQVIGATNRTERLDAMIHSKSDHLWVEWKHDADELGASVLDGSTWTPAGPEPWTDPSWVGTEDARKAVERDVLGP